MPKENGWELLTKISNEIDQDILKNKIKEKIKKIENKIDMLDVTTKGIEFHLSKIKIEIKQREQSKAPLENLKEIELEKNFDLSILKHNKEKLGALKLILQKEHNNIEKPSPLNHNFIKLKSTAIELIDEQIANKYENRETLCKLSYLSRISGCNLSSNTTNLIVNAKFYLINLKFLDLKLRKQQNHIDFHLDNIDYELSTKDTPADKEEGGGNAKILTTFFKDEKSREEKGLGHEIEFMTLKEEYETLCESLNERKPPQARM